MIDNELDKNSKFLISINKVPWKTDQQLLQTSGMGNCTILVVFWWKKTEKRNKIKILHIFTIFLCFCRIFQLFLNFFSCFSFFYIVFLSYFPIYCCDNKKRTVMYESLNMMFSRVTIWSECETLEETTTTIVMPDIRRH